MKPSGTCGVSCHSTKLNDIKHPSGIGTPLDGNLSSDKGKNMACVTCHMGPTLSHFWRINTDASFETFDHVNEVPNTFDDEGYAAMALDVDLACGQCHGGGTSPVDSPSKDGIMYFTKAALASYAEGMHTGGNVAPTAGYENLVNGNTATPKTRTVSFDDNSQGGNHEAQSSLAITVNWGDGKTSAGVGGSSFSHTYTSNGRFTIILTAQSGNLFDSELIVVDVSNAETTTKHSITVNVTKDGNPVNATVYLKKKNNAGQYVSFKMGFAGSDGTKVFNVPAGRDYKVVVYKSNTDFDGATAGKQTKYKENVDALSGDVTVNAAGVTP
jgi:hypothetical protein